MHDLEGLIVTLALGIFFAAAAYFVRVARLRQYSDYDAEDLKPLRRDSFGIFSAAVLFYVTTHYFMHV